MRPARPALAPGGLRHRRRRGARLRGARRSSRRRAGRRSSCAARAAGTCTAGWSERRARRRDPRRCSATEPRLARAAPPRPRLRRQRSTPRALPRRCSRRASRSSMAPDVAVVVGNYEGAACCPTASRASRRRRSAPAEVIVVDAGSTRRAAPRSPTAAGARVLTAPNHGLGFLYNRGVEATRAELRPAAEQRRRARAGLRRAARRRARRRRARASPPTRRSSTGTGERVIHAPHDARAAGGCCASTSRASTSTPSCRPTGSRRRSARNGAAMLVRRSLFARARRLRRDVLHGVGGPRPLLARLAARLAERLRAGRARPAPRRRGDDGEPSRRGGAPRRTTT